MNAAARLVKHLLEDADPEEVEQIATSVPGRLKWWMIPAVFIVKAQDHFEAEDIAADMQFAANRVQQPKEYGGMLFMDEELPSVEIKAQSGEDFDQERPHSMVGYVPGVVRAR